MDNLRAHSTTVVGEALRRHDIASAFLPPYSPDLNGIESVWSIVKNDYKRRHLASQLSGESPPDTGALVDEAVRRLDADAVRACARDGYERLFR